MPVKDEITTTATSQDRAAEATTRLRHALHLPELTATELKRLSLAIAEIAAEEAEANARFAERIYALYETLTPRKRSIKSEVTPYLGEDLVPISSAYGFHINVYGPPDPIVLLKIYGKEQLPRALSLFKPAKLKEAVARLMEEYPGTKPKTKTKTEDLIDYIIKQVAPE